MVITKYCAQIGFKLVILSISRDSVHFCNGNCPFCLYGGSRSTKIIVVLNSQSSMPKSYLRCNFN